MYNLGIHDAIRVIDIVSDVTAFSSNVRGFLEHPLITALIKSCSLETLTKACLRNIYVHPWGSISILAKLHPSSRPEIPEEACGRVTELTKIWLKWGFDQFGDKFWEGR